MMAMKAQLMKDTDTAEKIMACSTPAEAKTLGRQVQNFKQAVSARYAAVCIDLH